ncbi:MAG: class I SAM-dependent methyltransferase [Thermoplasmatota archaeon]
MKDKKQKKDKHFPNFGLNNPIRRWLDPPERLFGPYLSKGDVVADLGSGPGYYTFPMADRVGSRGIVYAVDSNEKAIKAIEKRKKRSGISNIKAYACSAHQLDFIEDSSVDFVLAEGLFCSIAPNNRDALVKEIQRIMKPDGLAHLSAARGSISYLTDIDWEEVLKDFEVKKRSDPSPRKGDNWALVTAKGHGR